MTPAETRRAQFGSRSPPFPLPSSAQPQVPAAGQEGRYATAHLPDAAGSAADQAGAIPLGDDDRRFYVVDHDGPPRYPAYYTCVYRAVDDPTFIASVAEFLRRRNIVHFNPGERPPTTAAKAALISLNQSEEDAVLQELVKRWLVDAIAAHEFNILPGSITVSSRSTRHAMDRYGILKLRKVRVGQSPQTVYALRNGENWVTATPDALRAEIGRATPAMKEEALHGEC